MDWKQKPHSEQRRLVLVVWILLISLKYSFGNKTVTFVLNGTTDTLISTSILSTRLSVFGVFTSTLNTLAQPLRPSYSSSIRSNLSTSNVVLQGRNTSSRNKTSSIAPTRSLDSFLVQATSQILAKSIARGGFMTLSNVSVLSSSIQALESKSTLSTYLNWSSTDVVLQDGNTTSTSTENSGSFLVPATSQILTTSITRGDFMTMSNISLLGSSVYSPKPSVSPTSTFFQLSSSVLTFRGHNKIFIAEVRIRNLNFTSELENKTLALFRTIASVVTASINFVMRYKRHYLGCQIVSFRAGSVIANFAITMGPGSNSDPNLALDYLKTAVASGRLGNLTVDSTYFQGWLKKEPAPREKLISGQLAGVAIIFFILVALLLVICLGNFADEPLFEERELFSAELTPRNVETGRDNEGSREDEEWKYDPLFAWSHKKVYNSKL